MNKKKGFTLIELIVVIAILGILAAVLIPKFSGFQDKAKRTQVVTDAKQFATAIDSALVESSTGAITALASTSTAATIAADTIVKLSGVDPTRITTLAYGTDGSFSFTSSVTNSAATPVAYTVTRAAGAAPVVSQ